MEEFKDSFKQFLSIVVSFTKDKRLYEASTPYYITNKSDKSEKRFFEAVVRLGEEQQSKTKVIRYTKSIFPWQPSGVSDSNCYAVFFNCDTLVFKKIQDGENFIYKIYLLEFGYYAQEITNIDSLLK